MKRIAVLTSGGDAPGMNAAIRAVVRYGINRGMEVYGIHRGYYGILDNDFELLEIRSVSDIIQRGGTILKTARCEEFKTKKGQHEALSILKERGIDGLVIIGGDGSFMGAKALSELGFPTIGIPGTIDNDLAYTDFTLGFDTACNTVLAAINNIRDTMSSHERIAVVEVMGRNCGDIALYAGMSAGAEVILIPEYKISMRHVIENLKFCKENGINSGIVVLAEGVGNAKDVSDELTKKTKFIVKPTVLGHIQRGGSPSHQDRYLGTVFGIEAIKLLEAGIGNRLIGIRKNKVINEEINEALNVKRKFNIKLYKDAMSLIKKY